MLRSAIAEEHIKSFEVARVKGGLRVKHKRYQGRVELVQIKGILVATLVCRDPADDWQLFQAFVGRLIYHFRDSIAAINVHPD